MNLTAPRLRLERFEDAERFEEKLRNLSAAAEIQPIRSAGGSPSGYMRVRSRDRGWRTFILLECRRLGGMWPNR